MFSNSGHYSSLGASIAPDPASLMQLQARGVQALEGTPAVLELGSPPLCSLTVKLRSPSASSAQLASGQTREARSWGGVPPDARVSPSPERASCAGGQAASSLPRLPSVVSVTRHAPRSAFVPWRRARERQAANVAAGRPRSQDPPPAPLAGNAFPRRHAASQRFAVSLR